uniref:Major facilitator superfamily (MFS) profile domain-containing protein n=1 Tax=Oryza meridionalis TaxID=40149 RepID=A0A0E0EDN3_9ORYZ
MVAHEERAVVAALGEDADPRRCNPRGGVEHRRESDVLLAALRRPPRAGAPEEEPSVAVNPTFASPRSAVHREPARRRRYRRENSLPGKRGSPAMKGTAGLTGERGLCHPPRADAPEEEPSVAVNPTSASPRSAIHCELVRRRRYHREDSLPPARKERVTGDEGDDGADWREMGKGEKGKISRLLRSLRRQDESRLNRGVAAISIWRAEQGRGSWRLSDRKVARFEKNVTKRGSVPETVKKGNDYPVGPIVLGFFVFVVVGSSTTPWTSATLICCQAINPYMLINFSKKYMLLLKTLENRRGRFDVTLVKDSNGTDSLMLAEACKFLNQIYSNRFLSSPSVFFLSDLQRISSAFTTRNLLGGLVNRDGVLFLPEMRRPKNKYGFVTAVLSSATPLLLGYDLVMVCGSAALPEPPGVKLLACVAVVSCVLGALAAVGAQCLVGDRCTVLLSAAVLCAGALARGLATSFAAFEAGVFVNSVGMGLALMSVPAYAGELSPSSLHGGLTSHPDGFVCLGCILGGLCFSPRFLNLPVRVAWRLTVATGTVIPALLGFAVLLMPESPRWLLTKDYARRVLSRTSVSLEDAELRLLETKTELGEPHDVGCDDTVPTPAWRTRWREERALWLDLLARPTEPVRRNIVSALVAKAFQQASGIGSMFLYVQRAFRDAGVPPAARMTRALVAFGLVVFAFFAVSMVLLELAWLLVKALAGGCCPRHAPAPVLSPSSADHPSSPHAHRGGVAMGMKRRREQLKWARSLSATMLMSLMALLWLLLGPVQMADASSSSGWPRWLRIAVAAVNRAVRAAILWSFAWVYEVTAVYGNLLACAAIIVFAWFLVYFCVLGAKER